MSYRRHISSMTIISSSQIAATRHKSSLGLLQVLVRYGELVITLSNGFYHSSQSEVKNLSLHDLQDS